MPISPRRQRGPDPLPLRLERQRIYILPSRTGLGWTILLASMFFGALNYMNNAALLLTCELAATMSLTMLATFRALYQLECRSACCDQAVAGRPSLIQLRLAGGQRWRRQLQARAENGSPIHFSLAPGHDGIMLALPAQFAHRGSQPLPAIQLLTRWPWGLFTGWSRLMPQGQVLVWPAPEVHGPPPPWQNAIDLQATGRNQASDMPESLRSYRPGDPQAHIAWKLLARSDEWLTKTAASSRHSRHFELSWTHTAGLAHEARIARLARWLNLATELDLSYSLDLPGQRLPIGQGERHRQACMNALARLP